jgi:CRISPR-associated protein Cmr6
LMSSKELKCRALDKYLGEEVLASSNVISALTLAFINCFREVVEEGESKVAEKESKVIENFVSYFNSIASEKIMLAYDCSRVRGLLEESRRHVVEVYERARSIFGSSFLIVGRLESRLLAHTRSPTLPLDISLAWDPVLNLPYIPASTVKGVVRAYLTMNNVTVEGLGVDDLLGKARKSEHEAGELAHVGYIVFFDAYPVGCERTLVEPDVITPHYSEVEGRVDETSVKPRPIVFPTIAPGTTIYFPVAVNVNLARRLKEKGKVAKLAKGNTVNEILEHVQRALEMGIGAKTSIGYGRVKITGRIICR